MRERMTRRPRLWQKLGLVLLAVGIPFGLASKRGWYVGAVAAIVYGTLAYLSVRHWSEMLRWSAQHPFLDSTFVIPFLFLALAYISTLPIAVCILISIVAGGAVIGLGGVVRSRRA